MKCSVMVEKAFCNKTLLVSGFIVVLIFSSCGPPDELLRKSVAELIPLLKDEDSVLRARAAMALGSKKAEAAPAVPELVKLLVDKKAHVRNRVMNALANIGQPAVSGLLEALQSRDRVMRYYAAHALRKIPAKQSQDAFKRWFEQEGQKLLIGIDKDNPNLYQTTGDTS
ncbi:MAG: HEAT repeat domain-containing protein [Candidatus Omnitrophica bacterium]|nr:HEAT repeat domain-containing protein [Candidatus Omnitrophota bacterium]